MRVAGIDVSSRSIDIVTIPVDRIEPGHRVRYENLEEYCPLDVRYWRLELEGTDAIDRASRAVEQIPRGTFWDQIARVHIERPYGPQAHTIAVLHLVIGAIVAALPERLRPPKLVAPISWRVRGLALPRDASKAEIRARVLELHAGVRRDLEQDAYDAVGIARSARAAELEAIAAAAQETLA